VKVLTIIEQDRPALLAEITAALEQAHIEIQDFNAQVIGGTAAISFHVRPYLAAFRLLSAAGYRVISHEHLLVGWPNILRAGRTVTALALAQWMCGVCTYQRTNQPNRCA
jgi:hypothetical protein